MNACNTGEMGEAGLMPALQRWFRADSYKYIFHLGPEVVLAEAGGSGGNTSHCVGKKGRRSSRSSPTDKKKQGTKTLRVTGGARRQCVQTCRAQK